MQLHGTFKAAAQILVPAICLLVFVTVCWVVGSATIGDDWDAPVINTPYQGNAFLYELNHGES